MNSCEYAIFDLINNVEKTSLLIKANKILHLNTNINKKLIFVYSGPKVGSTSIVSSLRIFGINQCSIIHMHDEEMLKVLGHIDGITINEIILFNKYLGRDVYVIDVYRSPIERKISAYFEKIGVYHFNNTDAKVNTYNIHKIINRFNKIMPHLATGDHFIDRYNITIPEKFDFDNKYLLVQQNGINYIKLRLKDSDIWSTILTKLFGFKICMVKDYETSNKPIKDIYTAFKNIYRIPVNLLNDINNCKYLNYFYSPSELKEYYNHWLQLSTTDFISYTLEEYKMYEELTIENSHMDYIQLDHYMDEGCLCDACNSKRSLIANQLLNGKVVRDHIHHLEANKEFYSKRIIQAAKIKKNIIQVQIKSKNFKQDMKNIVTGCSRNYIS
jgi:hypothetical protein